LIASRRTKRAPYEPSLLFITSGKRHFERRGCARIVGSWKERWAAMTKSNDNYFYAFLHNRLPAEASDVSLFMGK
jgi:hypothetical protein